MTRLGSMHHLRLTVSDIERSARVYVPFLAELGYRLVEQGEERLAWAGPGPSGVAQIVILSAVSDEFAGERANMLRPGLHHFAFNAESRGDVDRIYDVLCQLGVELQDKPKEYEYQDGYYAVYFRDPDNIKIEIVHVPR